MVVGTQSPTSSVLALHHHSTDEIVTPEGAAHLVEECVFPGQRRLDWDYIETVRDAMVRGKFGLSSIRLVRCQEDGKEYLTNGQHRVWAVTLAKVPIAFSVIRMTVSTFADVEEVYTWDDIGRRRTSLQLAAALHRTRNVRIAPSQFNKVIAATKFLLTGFLPSNRSLLPLYTFEKRHAAAMLLQDEAAAYFEAISGRPHSAGWRRFELAPVMAVALVSFLEAPERAAKWWRRAALQDGALNDSPEFTLVNRVLANKYPDHLLARYVAACWNAGYENRALNYVSKRNPTAPITIKPSPMRGKEDLRFIKLDGGLQIVPFESSVGWEG